MVFILVGLAFKISAVPFHMWTPDVYEGAPTSITSFFAVVPKVAGLALLIKFMFVPFSNILLEWQTIIIFISIASMILGAVAAMIQKNFKRLLAYSSIGHIGYALAGVATGAISGYQSAIVYISIYVIMNIGAFSCLFLLKKDGQYKENISDLSGISKKKSSYSHFIIDNLVFTGWSSTFRRIFCKVLCFCRCIGKRNVCFSNYRFNYYSYVSILLSQNHKDYLFR